MAAPAGEKEPKKPKPKGKATAKSKVESPIMLDQMKKAIAEAMPAQQQQNSWNGNWKPKGKGKRQG